MRQFLVLVVALTFFFGQQAYLPAQGIGVIEGTATGPAGPLANAAVQVVDAQGKIVGQAVTNATGNFRITNLPPGTYTVQTLGSSGAVISTSTATLTLSSMTATVTMSAAPAAIAGAAGAAGAAAGATTAGISTGAVVGGLAAAAAVAGTVAVVKNKSDASASR